MYTHIQHSKYVPQQMCMLSIYASVLSWAIPLKYPNQIMLNTKKTETKKFRWEEIHLILVFKHLQNKPTRHCSRKSRKLVIIAICDQTRED